MHVSAFPQKTFLKLFNKNIRGHLSLTRDRTANIWIGGVNVYFGTTFEPSGNVARSWHIERDLTDYTSLLNATQVGHVDLGNLVND